MSNRWPPASRRGPALNLLLLAATGLTTTMAGAALNGVDVVAEPGRLVEGLSFSVPLIAILLTHETGHYVMCRRHGVLATLPFFLPGPPIPLLPGTFGAFIRIKSPFPDRRALFDIGAAGPWAGFVVALVATIVGLGRSTVLTQPLPESGSIMLGDSMLTAWLARWVAGAEPDLVMLHPTALAGWFGLFVTSLNLLPVGQLDGGHVLYAAGLRARGFQALLIACLLWLAWRGWPGWVVWSILLLVMLQLGHPPTLDDEVPLDGPRRVGVALSFLLFGLTFVAEPFRIPG